jgi:hypothetical protein
MNHYSRLFGLVALLAVGLLVAVGGAAGAAPSAPSVAPVSRAAPLDTPSPTPANSDPEWAILQYVLDHNNFWMCSSIGGTPGHRTLSCYSMAGHWADGSVENYGDPAVAATQWQQRRATAQAIYPHFADSSYNGYPGYDAYDEVYNPTAEWEDYYWADVRVLGATRHDDTHFRYSPDMAAMIMQAAAMLGYLPPPSPTPTPSPTLSPTVTPTAPTATPTLSPTVTPTAPTATPALTPEATATLVPLPFVDLDPANPFYAYVRTLYSRGIVSGYTTNPPCLAGVPCFLPGNPTTRGQVAKVVASAAGYNEVLPSTQQTFADVPPGSTFWLYIERLATRGIIGGYPCGGPFEPCLAPDNRPYFRPNNNVTRGQIAKITSGAAGWTATPTSQTFADVPPGSPFYPYVEAVASRGIVGGYPCGGPGEPCLAPDNRPYFRPNNNATRGQVAKIAAAAFFPNGQAPTRR